MYYSEDIKKDTKERNDYSTSIYEYLQEQRKLFDLKREKYINAEKLILNTEKYRNEFIDVLGYPLNEKRTDIALLKKEFVAKDKNVEIYRMQFLIFGKIKFYGLYFQQAENKSDMPFVIGFHGGDGTPELVSSIHGDSANYNHLVRRITDKGANVFVPQLLLWSKTLYGNEYDRLSVDGKLRQIGGSITAFELAMVSNCLDYFVSEKIANVGKIGAVGMSYGGMYSLLLSAIDTRISSCFSCSWVEDSFNVSWADWSYKNAYKTFTSSEICALVAPRRLVVEMGNKDELFSSEKTVETCKKVNEYYACYKSADNFKYVIFDGNHEVDKNDDGLNFFYCILEK